MATVETTVSVLHRWQGNDQSRILLGKNAQLLHLAGMEVQDIYEDLPDPGPLNADQDNEYMYVACLRKLDAYLRAEENVRYERHVFRQLIYQSNRILNIPLSRQPLGHLNFGKCLVKFTPPEAEKLFKCPIIGPFQVIKCPHPRETFQ